MDIKYLGWQSFLLKGKEASVVTQPFSKQDGADFPKIKADIILGNKLSKMLGKKKKPVFFYGPGEYEVSGVEVQGFRGGFWFMLDGRGITWLYEYDEYEKAPEASTDLLFIGITQGNGDWEKRVEKILSHFSPAYIFPFPTGDTSLSKEQLKSFSWSKRFLDMVDEEKLDPIDLLQIADTQELGEEKNIVLLNPSISSRI
jgi:hypothetical protein